MISLVFDVIVRRTAVHLRRKATRLPSIFVWSGALVGSSDRPRSMYMMCLDEVGGIAGIGEGRSPKYHKIENPTKNWGKKPSPRELFSGLKRNDPRF